MSKSLTGSTLIIGLLISFYVFFNGYNKDKVNYFLIFQLFIGCLLVFLPFIFERTCSLIFPTSIVRFYHVFLILSIFLGTGLNLVNKVPHWDKGLHVLCGIFFTLLAYSLLSLFDKQAAFWTYILFGISFSVFIGVLWECWEFFCDCFLGLNLQQFNQGKGIAKVGQEALLDTMIDLLADLGGAGLMTVLSFIRAYKKPNYFQQFFVGRHQKPTE